MKPLYLLLFVSTLAHAEVTSQQWQKRKQLLTEISASFQHAEEHLSPCDGLDYMAEVALRSEPPRSCENARGFYDVEAAFYRTLRESCREVESFAQDKFRDEEFFYLPRLEKTKIKDEFRQIANRPQENTTEVAQGDAEEKYMIGFGEDPESSKGEYQNMDCHLPVTVHLQARKKILSLYGRYKNFADQAFYEAIESNGEPPSGVTSYLNYARDGEAGLASR